MKDNYERQILQELKSWQREMTRRPTFTDKFAKNIQTRFNNLIPRKAHRIITLAIKNMVMAVLSGSEYITAKPVQNITLEERERIVKEKHLFYRRTASLEGAGTGAGGILLGLADFPLLLSIKIRFLFDVASVYGYDVRKLEERLYILHLFQLAFSSRGKRLEVYRKVLRWDEYLENHPSMDCIDWQEFQQEYRDYLDLAKLLQFIPLIGALFGAYANHKLLDELGKTAMNGYRLRILKDYINP